MEWRRSTSATSTTTTTTPTIISISNLQHQSWLDSLRRKLTPSFLRYCVLLCNFRGHTPLSLCARQTDRFGERVGQLHSDDSFTRTTAIQARNEIFLSTSLFRSHTRCHIPVFPAVCPSTTAAFDASMLFDIMTPQTSAMLRVSELRESELLFGHPSRR